MDDAAAGGHPLRATGFEQADIADTVLVAQATIHHDRHGLETAVRMIREAADVTARGVAAEGAEHEERIEALLQRLRQHARHPDTIAIGRGLATHDSFDLS